LAIINIQLEKKPQISARTPGHWRNRKVIESMPLLNQNRNTNTNAYRNAGFCPYSQILGGPKSRALGLREGGAQ